MTFSSNSNYQSIEVEQTNFFALSSIRLYEICRSWSFLFILSVPSIYGIIKIIHIWLVDGIQNTCSLDYHSCEPMRLRDVWLDLNWSNTKCAYIFFFHYRKFDVFRQNDVDDDDCWWCKFDMVADGVFWWRVSEYNCYQFATKLYTSTYDDHKNL